MATYKLLRGRLGNRKGATVYDFKGYDYGCCRDDKALDPKYKGIEHVALTRNADGSGPFFTCPVTLLERLEGEV